MKVKHITVDFTGLNTYRSCPEKFNFGYVERRKPVAPSDALVFGQCIHTGLAEWHLGGPVGSESVCEQNFIELAASESLEYMVPHDCARCRSLVAFANQARGTHLRELPDDRARSIRHGLNLLWAYYRAYGEDPFHSFKPAIGQDQKPLVEKMFTAKLTDRITYKGTMDMAAQDFNGNVHGVEHKTTYYLNEAFLNKARMSDQVTGYIFLLQENVHPDVNSVVWNALQTAPRKIQTSPEECFSRTTTRRTPEQMLEWRENTILTVERMIEDIEREKFVKNMPDACCAWNSLCAFADVCNSPWASRKEILAAEYLENDWEGVLVEYESA